MAWHLPSPQTVSTRRFVEMIFEETGGEFKMQRAPRVLFRAMGLFNPAMRELVEMLYEFEEPFVVDHSNFKQTFGEHATPLKEAKQTRCDGIAESVLPETFIQLPRINALRRWVNTSNVVLKVSRVCEVALAFIM